MMIYFGKRFYVAFLRSGLSRMLLLLILKTWITGTKLIVGDVGINMIFMEVMHIVFTGKACIGGYYRTV